MTIWPLVEGYAYTPTRRSELSNLSVRAIGQDDYGYIWVATANGLCKSYGDEYELYFADIDDSQTIPSNSATSLYTDADGWLLVATTGGVCGQERGSRHFRRFTLGSTAAGNFQMCSYGFAEYAGRLFCYGTGGLYEMDKETLRLTQRVRVDGGPVKAAVCGPDGLLWISNGMSLMGVSPTLNIVFSQSFDAVRHVNAIAAAGDCLLLGTPNGIVSFSPATQALAPTPVGPDTEVNAILALDDGKYIVSTGNRGVLVYDHAAATVGHAYHNVDFTELLSAEINNVFYDKDCNFWVSTFDKGAVLLSNRPSLFNADRDLVKAFRDEFVTRAIFDGGGNLWVGTRYNGIVSYDAANKSKRYYNSHTTPDLATFSYDFVQEMMFDDAGRLWTGYNNSLIVCEPNGSGGLAVVKRFPIYDNVVSMAQDASGAIWVGTSDDGLYVIDRDMEIVGRVGTPDLHSNNITKIIPYDRDHMLVAAYSDNLYLVNTRDVGDISTFTPSDSEVWRSAIDMMIDHDGNLWIATYHHGLLRVDGRSREVVACLGASTVDIVGLCQALNGDVWASSSYGIYRFDVAGRQISSYLKHDGLGGNQFHEKCVASMSWGRILFGGNAGIEEIVPAQGAAFTPPDYISLVLNDLTIIPGNRSAFSGDVAAAAAESLTLSHGDNSVSIEFFATRYDKTSDVEYAYMLKGQDKDFIEVGNFRRAPYSDLAPGTYQFYVKTRLKGGEWQEPVRLLELTIKPNPWLSSVALSVYFAIAIALILFINRLYLRFKLIKQQYALSEERIRAEKRNTDSRINFFTNISHELRTPLSLICGPVKRLKANYHDMSDGEVQEQLGFLDTNVERLMTLINQLLNFRRVASETLPLRVARGDLGAQLSSLAKLYTAYASERHMTIVLEKPTEEPILLTYDADKVEKIVSNLVVNAIKYSNDNGIITIGLTLSDRRPAGLGPGGEDRAITYAIISVADQGRGVEEKEIPMLFQPFKRLLGIDEAKKTEGFGIGLHYVANLAAEHKGAVRTTKNPQGGMTFTVLLPASDEAFASSEFSVAPSWLAAEPPAATVAGSDDDPAAADDAAGEEADEMPKILVVEDNAQLNTFIASLFRSRYTVMQAYDGEEALAMATADGPDIIVSDVLMPGEVDGIELCRRIKSDDATSHIPVVLLTAKTLETDKIEGYNSGADAYLCKPFSPEVLAACVNNLDIKRRRRAERILASAGLSNPPADTPAIAEELSPLDKKFLDKLYAYIDSSFDNCDLNVNMLGRELGFSRANFYRKVKALTGISPNDLLRVYRLNRAAELLLTREYTVCEVGERTGFGNQSHFSSLFKKHFGMSPRAYVASRFPQDQGRTEA